MNTKQLLNEWRSFLNENENKVFTYDDIKALHNEKTLYHITMYNPEHFSKGMTLDNAKSLSTKEYSSSQGSGVYFFCKPYMLEKAFSTNKMEYLLILEEDYINMNDFLPDLEICAGFFVKWFAINYKRLCNEGFNSNIIKKVTLKGEKSSLYASGIPHTMIVTVPGYMNITDEYTSYNNFRSESGKPLNLILDELKTFDENEYNDCISYVKSQDIDSVKYVGKDRIVPLRYFKLDRVNNTFRELKYI